MLNINKTIFRNVSWSKGWTSPSMFFCTVLCVSFRQEIDPARIRFAVQQWCIFVRVDMGKPSISFLFCFVVVFVLMSFTVSFGIVYCFAQMSGYFWCASFRQLHSCFCRELEAFCSVFNLHIIIGIDGRFSTKILSISSWQRSAHFSLQWVLDVAFSCELKYWMVR